MKTLQSLSHEERETIFSWCDNDKDKFFIYSTQPHIICRLLKNPLFELKKKLVDKHYYAYPNPICVEGYLPHKALTLRCKIRKLSKKERKAAIIRLKNAREARSATIERSDGNTKSSANGRGRVEVEK